MLKPLAFGDRSQWRIFKYADEEKSREKKKFFIVQ